MEAIIFNFNCVNANNNNQRVYKTEQHYFLQIIENKWYQITPSLAIDISTNKPKVGFEVLKGYADEDNIFRIEYIKKQSQKKYEIRSKLLDTMINLEAAIHVAVKKSRLGQTISAEFDDKKQYIRLENINEKLKEYLENIDEIGLNDDLILLGQVKTTKKTMECFRNDLVSVLDENEPTIHKVLKKYSRILSLVLLGVDSTLKFEFTFETEGMESNRADAIDIDSIDPKNIIEIKRANECLFDKSKRYRNNTYSLTKAFSSAIQQANVQRHHFASSSKDPLSPLCKSILIIGNAFKEFSQHPDKDILNYNLSVVKYDNKDITIMTYDEILTRINSLISVNSN